jgi:hypothetical protein
MVYDAARSRPGPAASEEPAFRTFKMPSITVEEAAEAAAKKDAELGDSDDEDDLPFMMNAPADSGYNAYVSRSTPTPVEPPAPPPQAGTPSSSFDNSRFRSVNKYGSEKRVGAGPERQGVGGGAGYGGAGASGGFDNSRYDRSSPPPQGGGGGGGGGGGAQRTPSALQASAARQIGVSPGVAQQAQHGPQQPKQPSRRNSRRGGNGLDDLDEDLMSGILGDE